MEMLKMPRHLAVPVVPMLEVLTWTGVCYW